MFDTRVYYKGCPRLEDSDSYMYMYAYPLLSG